MEYDLIILTTAVNRPDLHNKVFPDYCKFVSDLNCLWIINIDCIHGGASSDTTKENLNQIINEWSNISVQFSVNEDAGTRKAFYESAQRLINTSIKIKSKYGIFWLEDDWGMNNFRYKLQDILKQLNFSDMDYLQLVDRNKEVSFNPGIFGNGIFKKYNFIKINDESNGFYMTNPERACCVPINSFLVENHYEYPHFFDVGRGWSESNINASQYRPGDIKSTFNMIPRRK